LPLDLHLLTYTCTALVAPKVNKVYFKNPQSIIWNDNSMEVEK